MLCHRTSLVLLSTSPYPGGGADPLDDPLLLFHKGLLFQAANTNWAVCCLCPRGGGEHTIAGLLIPGLVRSAAPTTHGSWLVWEQLGASEESHEVQAGLVRTRNLKFLG